MGPDTLDEVQRRVDRFINECRLAGVDVRVLGWRDPLIKDRFLREVRDTVNGSEMQMHG